MSFFTNLKIAKRLGYGYSLILALVVMLIITNLYNITRLNAILEHIVKENNEKADAVMNIRNALDDLFLNVAHMVIARDHIEIQKEQQKVEANRAVYRNSLVRLEKLEGNAEGKALIARLKDAIVPARDANNSAMELALAGKYDDAVVTHKLKIKPLLEKLDVPLEALIAYEEQLNRERYDEAVRGMGYACIITLIVGGGSFLLCLAIGYYTARSITRPVALGVSFANRMAEGDLTQVLDVHHQDEIGELAGALNQMAVSLRTMFREMNDGVQTLSASATELSAISRQMSGNAEHSSMKAHSVATAAEEMSASMASVAMSMQHATSNVNSVAAATEEMTATIGEIVHNSEQSRIITDQAVQQTSQITVQVAELGQAAREIGNVTAAIAAISSQTNLLALNATIEAARAGAAGKGFTVVAGEIKTLAQQTAAATVDIRERIEKLQTSTAETIADIDKISEIIQGVGEVITSTSLAIEQQSSATRDIAANIAQAAYGIQEISDNVDQASQVSAGIALEITESNQSAGEIAASSVHVLMNSEELTRLAEQLKTISKNYRV